jgi:hypothetical protein
MRKSKFTESQILAALKHDLPHPKRTPDYAALRCSNCSGVW